MSSRHIALEYALKAASNPTIRDIETSLDIVQVAELFHDFLNPPNVGDDLIEAMFEAADYSDYEPTNEELDELDQEIFIEEVLENAEALVVDQMEALQEGEVLKVHTIAVNIKEEDEASFQEDLEIFLLEMAEHYDLDYTGING
jgi:hypothetical protein